MEVRIYFKGGMCILKPACAQAGLSMHNSRFNPEILRCTTQITIGISCLVILKRRYFAFMMHSVLRVHSLNVILRGDKTLKEISV